MTSAELKHRFACALSNKGDDRINTVRYMVYRTIMANPRISVARLKKLLEEYLIDETTFCAAVASLAGRTLFNAVARTKAEDGATEDIRLTVKKTLPQDFADWLAEVERSRPDLVVFDPPVYVYKPQAVAA